MSYLRELFFIFIFTFIDILLLLLIFKICTMIFSNFSQMLLIKLWLTVVKIMAAKWSLTVATAFVTAETFSRTVTMTANTKILTTFNDNNNNLRNFF